MQIIPAIDLKDKNAVRLSQGKMDSAKIYSTNPVELALSFMDMGASYLHIVDLDGAIHGSPKNLEVIEKIAKDTRLKIQVGGGIRNEETICRYLELGVHRVILGSIALSNPQFAKEMADKYKIIIGIDAKEGYVATQGWDKQEDILAVSFAKEFKDSNIEAIICTDIARDGMLNGVNVEFTKEIAQNSGKFTIASGGLSSQSDVDELYKSNVDGVIVGKAFYENKLDLKMLFCKYSD